MDKPINTQKKVPAIRFQGFSGEWEEKELKDICEETYGGGTPSTSQPEYWGGDIPWIQSSDIAESNIKNAKYKKSITKMGLEKSASKLVPENSLAIVTRVGVGKVSLLNMSYATSQDFLSLSRLNIDYLYSAYAVWRKMQSIKLVVQGTSIKGITKDELLDEVIGIPKNPKEQTQIGDFFQALDDLIAKREQKHAKLGKIKQALLGKLFPQAGETVPQMRFIGFSGDWEEKTLGEVFNYQRPDKYIVKSTDYSDKYSTPVLTANKGFLLGYTNEKATFDMPSIIFDDFTLDYKYIDFPYMVKSSAIKILTIKNERTDNLIFACNLLNNTKLETMGHARHYISVVQKVQVVLPNIKEQTQIGNLFQRLDTLIDQYGQQITTLKNIKQGYLNKMFI